MMVENDSAPSESTTETPSETSSSTKGSSREIWLAIIQHGNRSIVIFLIFLIAFIGVIVARRPLFEWLSNAESVKLGSFEVRSRERAKLEGLGKEFSDLTDLSDEQIQLFLVLDRERKSNASGPNTITYIGEEVTANNLNKLESIGLLKDVKWTEGVGFSWTVTDVGARLHNVLLQNIASSLRNVPK